MHNFLAKVRRVYIFSFAKVDDGMGWLCLWDSISNGVLHIVNGTGGLMGIFSGRKLWMFSMWKEKFEHLRV